MKCFKYTIIIFIVTIYLMMSCQNNKEIKFDKAKWEDQEDPLFPPRLRKQMLEDLIENHKMVGQRFGYLIDLLGLPDYKDSNSLSYKVVVEYKKDIDPVYTKNLEFTFSKDSSILSYKVVEWKK